MKKEQPYEPENVQEVLDAAAELLKESHPKLPDLIYSIRDFIIEHAQGMPSDERIQPESILESRFTSPQEAFQKGMMSCGAIVNISTEMLRHVGFKVKLVHGGTEQAAAHAWISVLNPETGAFEEYDLAQGGGAVTAGYVKTAEADSWEDIRDQIEEDYRTLGGSRKAPDAL